MLDGNTWPIDMSYSKCSMTDITAVTRNNFDLRKAFADVMTQNKQSKTMLETNEKKLCLPDECRINIRQHDFEWQWQILPTSGNDHQSDEFQKQSLGIEKRSRYLESWNARRNIFLGRAIITSFSSH
jgi:hypothetical protein